MSDSSARGRELARRISDLLARHRLGAFLVTVAGMPVTADGFRRTYSDTAPHAGAFPWVAIALMATTPLSMVTLTRRVDPRGRLMLAWLQAVLPGRGGRGGEGRARGSELIDPG